MIGLQDVYFVGNFKCAALKQPPWEQDCEIMISLVNLVNIPVRQIHDCCESCVKFVPILSNAYRASFI